MNKNITKVVWVEKQENGSWKITDIQGKEIGTTCYLDALEGSADAIIFVKGENK